jgi:hypothetical protein
MERHLSGLRVLNYGFSGLGYSHSYLDAINRVLDPNSARKVIVLGITPHSLTKGAARENGFTEWVKKSSFDRVCARHFGAAFHLFRPLDPGEVYRVFALFGLCNKVSYYQEYHPDGWVASYKVPETPQEGLERYSRIFDLDRSGPVDSKNVDLLIQTVAYWRLAGIEVYGFRPPNCSEMQELENRLSKFDEEAFRTKFEEAGGVWFECKKDSYRSYDSSHLHRNAAVRLSRRLAKKIAVLK